MPPAWSIRPKLKSEKVLKDSPPGPGAYTVSPSKPQAYSQCKSTRFLSTAERCPGPGTYSPTALANQPGPSTDKAKRVLNLKTTHNPGPGTYESPNAKNDKSYTMQAKPNDPESQVNPGPGSYAVSDNKTGPKYTFKGRHFLSRSMDVPGPGQYEAKSSISNKAASIDKAVRYAQGLDTAGPGPASYTIETGKGGNFTLRSRVRYENTIEGTPGPGSYEISSTNTKKTYAMARGRRFNEISERVPGPGTYGKSDHAATSSFSFGSSKKIDKKSEVPAPGSYEVSQNIIRGKGYTLGKDKAKNEGCKYPGPGAYNPPCITKRNRLTVFPKGRRGSTGGIKDEKPGPGMYKPLLPPGISYGIGTGARLNSSAKEMPGPGSYNIKSSIGHRDFKK